MRPKNGKNHMARNISRRQFLFARAFARDESGASAIEYGIIASLLGVAIIGSARLVGTRTNRKLDCANQTMKSDKKGKAC
jgi:pilus assembly protein Flp/PilA